jgi:hypothetical protein
MRKYQTANNEDQYAKHNVAHNVAEPRIDRVTAESRTGQRWLQTGKPQSWPNGQQHADHNHH